VEYIEFSQAFAFTAADFHHLQCLIQMYTNFYISLQGSEKQIIFYLVSDLDMFLAHNPQCLRSTNTFWAE
jgi:hypothetical protein